MRAPIRVPGDCHYDYDCDYDDDMYDDDWKGCVIQVLHDYARKGPIICGQPLIHDHAGDDDYNNNDVDDWDDDDGNQ